MPWEKEFYNHFFFLIGKNRIILKEGTKRKTQKHTGSIQKDPKGTPKGREKQTRPLTSA